MGPGFSPPCKCDLGLGMKNCWDKSSVQVCNGSSRIFSKRPGNPTDFDEPWSEVWGMCPQMEKLEWFKKSYLSLEADASQTKWRYDVGLRLWQAEVKQGHCRPWRTMLVIKAMSWRCHIHLCNELKLVIYEGALLQWNKLSWKPKQLWWYNLLCYKWCKVFIYPGALEWRYGSVEKILSLLMCLLLWQQ